LAHASHSIPEFARQRELSFAEYRSPVNIGKACENFHAYIPSMPNKGPQPDEATRLHLRDVAITVLSRPHSGCDRQLTQFLTHMFEDGLKYYRN
jgi:hypothetical protein